MTTAAVVIPTARPDNLMSGAALLEPTARWLHGGDIHQRRRDSRHA